MEYRAQKKLPAITLSASLTTVARAHVEDLAAHPPKDVVTCIAGRRASGGPDAATRMGQSLINVCGTSLEI